jgi:Domain of unknown function (DUF4160)
VPVIPRFFGLVIRMYFLDHEPSRFHVLYGGDEAVIRIAPLTLLAGTLPRRALALVFEWATLHSDRLLENWRRLRSDESPIAIPPLE